MNRALLLSVLFASASSAAETPSQILDAYTAEAARQTPGFQPNAGLGEHLYTRNFAASRRTSCVACHADSPLQARRPLDPKQVERQLARDCRLVVGRECSAGEKADLLSYLAAN